VQAFVGTSNDRDDSRSHLERVGALCLAIDHLHDLLVDALGRGVTHGPVVARSAAILGDKDVLRIVEVAMRCGLDPVDDARFEVEHDGARDVVLVVGLVEEDVLAVAAVGRPFLECALGGDAMLGAELLPKGCADLVAALSAFVKEELLFDLSVCAPVPPGL
jgi:hypothetical protein